MPQRPRQHQLEAESKHAFVGELPVGWLYRDVTPDYGIDGLVEVFDESDMATGGMYFVQLKGTDEEDLTEALRVDLKVDTVAYYQSILLPVLVVVYQATTKSVFARYVEKYDLPKHHQATQSFRLTEHDRWGESIVLETLRRLRQLKGIGFREALIREYYDAKRSIVWSEPYEGSLSSYSMPEAGARVVHHIFGFGVVESAIESYAFVAFDLDEGISRKFLPGDFHELRPVLSES